MKAGPFASLKPYAPRRTVPEEVDLADWTQVEPFFARLEAQVQDPRTDLYRWIFELDELSVALDQVGSIRYALMTMYTDDEEHEKAYLQFNNEIVPRWKQRAHRLDELYQAHPGRKSLSASCTMRDRVVASDAEIHRDENIPLETELSELVLEFKKISGAQTVEWEGQERTLIQLDPVLQETDRARRRSAWELAARRRLADQERLDALFAAMLRLRKRIAANAGFASYRDFRFRQLNRFDYTAAECREFHLTVEQLVVPLVARLDEERRGALGLETLRPWDMMVDIDGRPPLSPFQTAGQLVEGCRKIFERIEPEFGRRLAALARQGLLELENRKGKAPGGYQAGLDESRTPFIFMNSVGLHRDVTTLLHEGGHAFHTFESRDQEIAFNRGHPIEFAEVASMSMELIGMEHMEVFYRGDDLRRARKLQLERVVRSLPMLAMGDEFQHWIYENPDHPDRQRHDRWLELSRRFGSGFVDWTGYEEERAAGWQAILHFFEIPFYFIEYAFAQLGALQVWRNYREDPRGAIDDYRRGLALGWSRPLPELFAAAGARFDFRPETVKDLFELVGAELEACGGSHASDRRAPRST